MNVSSIVVQAMSQYIDDLVETFKNADFCEYHLHDKEKGKIILTVEGEGVEEEIEKLIMIQKTPNVMAADMMMTYQEDQLDEEIKKLNEQDPVPAMLNDDTIDAKDIVYNGDLKKKDFGF
ncbi:chaperone NapD [Sulfurovum sp. ST-21]|uniref:Chaperone NapD n=1 Tax=Sulfurovum indicum TaxID=2779528 RepID=A0A7M1S2P1_9BACT|nr:chaperone NapD [Sulfurovum indicum]QOR61638.1 chaperone NapD [Sulfurovum indicum]